MLLEIIGPAATAMKCEVDVALVLNSVNALRKYFYLQRTSTVEESCKRGGKKKTRNIKHYIVFDGKCHN